MKSTPNKQIVQAFFEVYNTQDYDSLDECMNSDYMDHSLPLVRSISDAIAVLKSTHRAFPDIHVQIDELIEEGDRVVFRGRFKATHLGDFIGNAPSGAKIEFEAIEIFKIRGHKISESWGYWPTDAILAQIQRAS